MPRGRKATTTTAEAERETPLSAPPSAGHNSQGPLIRKHFSAIKRLKEELDSANAKLRNAYQAAEADGLDGSTLKNMLLAKKKEAATVVVELKRTISYMEALDIPVTWQELFEQTEAQGAPHTEVSEELTGEQRDAKIWDADDQGFEASKAGRSIDDSQYVAGSAEYAAWRSGFNRHQATLAFDPKPASSDAGAVAPADPETDADLEGG